MKTAIAALIVLTLAGAAAFMRPAAAPRLPEAAVSRQPFVESLVESGTITAARVAVYGAPLGALPAKIVEIAPEGSAVEAGDLLVRLDIAPLEQMLEREMAALRRAEADLAAERVAARMKAREDALQLLEAEAALTDAGREVARAHAAIEDLRPMLAERFITRTEFERAEQALARATEQRALAAARRELRAAAVPGAPRATGAAAAADEIRLRIETLRRQMALSTIRAQAPGLVVYRELFFGSERRKPQVGDEALPNQPLIAIPDAGGLLVDTRVREIDLHGLAASQRVRVSVDAYPGLDIEGRVDVIGALAQADVMHAGTRYFPVTVRLLEADPRLRSGMTAQVRIEVSTIPSALVVPIEAVHEDDEGAYCLVAEARGVVRRRVQVWSRTATHAAIKSGLLEGERVRLAAAPR